MQALKRTKRLIKVVYMNCAQYIFWSHMIKKLLESSEIAKPQLGHSV